MSWFDASGIASLAKTALKEAQKTIDKALDIQDDDATTGISPIASALDPMSEVSSTSTSSLAAALVTTPRQHSKPSTALKHSISNPALPPSSLSTSSDATAAANSIWGSFTGSFFDNSNGDDVKTVTTPPSSGAAAHQPRRDSSQRQLLSESSGGSVEIVSPPTTPGSSLTSPDPISTVHGSESIDVITPSSDLVTISSSSSSSFMFQQSEHNIAASSTTATNPYADSIEIIADDDDDYLPPIEDDISIDDEDSRSYNTTVSETATTILAMDSSATSHHPTGGVATITKAPSRSSLHLDFVANAASSVVATKPSTTSMRRSISSAADLAATELSSSLVTNQLEDAASMDKSIELFDEQTHLSDSTQSFEYVKQDVVTVAATADDVPLVISLKQMPNDDVEKRSGSPNSSDDIVKINSSEPTSGHTSADEVETATSSDIEIISSPNGGDSSSTNSAYKVSPSMCVGGGSGGSGSSGTGGGGMPNSHMHHTISDGQQKKGHVRELSTHSIQSTASDDSRLSSASTETERLVRRINEMSEILESREYKLMELGRENAELNERTADMRQQLDAKRKRDDCLEVTSVTEEYTQRLSALEKKFQMSIRERDNLREQLKVARNEVLSKVSREDVDAVHKEKDYLICELKLEGEKLSKQILQHSNIIKRLRVKEREADATMKRQKEQLDETAEEMERLKKSLAAKDDVERSQIEAIHRLSSENRKLERDAVVARNQLDDNIQRLKAVQTSFEAARRELTDKQHAAAELSRKSVELVSLESKWSAALQQQQQQQTELLQLRERLRQSESGTGLKEKQLRQENGNLLRRLEDAELRLEQDTQSVTDATIPLVRQLDALQTTLNVRSANWDRQERKLLEQVEQLESQCKRIREAEQTGRERTQELSDKTQQLEVRLCAALLKAEQSAGQLQQRTVEFELSEADFKQKLANLKMSIEKSAANEEQLQRRVSELQQQFDAERRLLKRQLHRQTADEQEIPTSSVATDGVGGPDEKRGSSSPTLSLGRMSMADSFSSNMWPLVSFFFFFIFLSLT